MGCSNGKQQGVTPQDVQKIKERSSGQISEKDIVYWHKIWKKISPNGKMTENQFVNFIVENKIGSGKELDARNMFRMIDKDKNGLMEFDEFILILLLPKSADEISAEQFANLCMTIYDEDNNGFISEDELMKFALAKAKADGRISDTDKSQVREVVAKIIAYIDENSDGQLSKDELVRAINRDPNLKKVL